jgi:hypothetical protein
MENCRGGRVAEMGRQECRGGLGTLHSKGKGVKHGPNVKEEAEMEMRQMSPNRKLVAARLLQQPASRLGLSSLGTEGRLGRGARASNAMGNGTNACFTAINTSCFTGHARGGLRLRAPGSAEIPAAATANAKVRPCILNSTFPLCLYTLNPNSSAACLVFRLGW